MSQWMEYLYEQQVLPPAVNLGLAAYPQDTEKTFKKYTELIPGDPNPYDSYAELLLKTGRYDEAVAQYQEALRIDPTLVAARENLSRLDGPPAGTALTPGAAGIAAQRTGGQP